MLRQPAPVEHKKSTFDKAARITLITLLGSFVVAGVTSLALSLKSRADKSSAASSDKAMCEVFKDPNYQPAKSSVGSITVPSGLVWQNKDPSQPDIDNAMAYKISTDTSDKPLAASCALITTVSLEINDEPYAQTLLAAEHPGQKPTIDDILTSFNDTIDDSSQPAEARQSALNDCRAVISVILNGMGANATEFADQYFPPTFIADGAALRTRMDYAPYTAAQHPVPAANNPASASIREIWLQNDDGGAVYCHPLTPAA